MTIIVGNSAPATVQAQPTGTYPNQPPGSVLVSDYKFEVNPDPVSHWGAALQIYGNFSLVTSGWAGTPLFGGKVGRMFYPNGFPYNGTEPALIENTVLGAWTKLYLAFGFQLSGNWVPHPTGVNKILFLSPGPQTSNRLIVNANMFGSPAAGVLDIHLQAVPTQPNGDSSVNLTPNINNATSLIAGRWHRCEVVVENNTANNGDGTIKWWVDNILRGSYVHAGALWNGKLGVAGEAKSFGSLTWAPTWGGGGSGNLVLPAGMSQFMDSILISGHA